MRLKSGQEKKQFGGTSQLRSTTIVTCCAKKLQLISVETEFRAMAEFQMGPEATKKTRQIRKMEPTDLVMVVQLTVQQSRRAMNVRVGVLHAI